MDIRPESIAVITSLVAVIGVLWKLLVAASNREQERLKKCETMHEEAKEKLISLTGDMNYLKGRMDGVEQLSASVLVKIEESNNVKDS